MRLEFINTWQEITSTIRKNKLRTFFTGFSVAWGIFMLMLLLGAGNGLKNGVTQNFSAETKNVISVWPGRTTIATDGFQKGRRIRFNDKDALMLRSQFGNISSLSPVISQYVMLSCNNDFINYEMQGVMPDYNTLQSLPLYSGRFINEIDQQQQRKVVVLEKSAVDILFKKENPVGKYVNANNVPFQVVGVYENINRWGDGVIYVPFSTAQAIFNITEYPELAFEASGLNTLKENEDYNDVLRARFATLHSFDSHDNRAIWIWNRMEDYIRTMNIFSAIDVFIWIIGIGTLIAGIVGVSNIMIVTVKDRTKELGIRKAIGATPWSILKLIITESLVITTFFGYIGLLGGVAVTEALNYLMPHSTTDKDSVVIFTNPTVDIHLAIAATVVLIVAGVLAGFFPARKAVKIKPTEALRYE
jgi:putative ABC transport system permease protein